MMTVSDVFSLFLLSPVLGFLFAFVWTAFFRWGSLDL